MSSDRRTLFEYCKHPNMHPNARGVNDLCDDCVAHLGMVPVEPVGTLTVESGKPIRLPDVPLPPGEYLIVPYAERRPTMSDQPTFSEPATWEFDHDFQDEAGYCRECGAQAFMHDERLVNQIFDWMERAGRR